MVAFSVVHGTVEPVMLIPNRLFARPIKNESPTVLKKQKAQRGKASKPSERNKFPLIYRIISRVALTLLFVVFTGYFIEQQVGIVKTNDELGQLKYNVLLDSTNPRTHSLLAAFFEKHNDYANAKREYLLASAFGGKNATTDFARVLKKEQARTEVGHALKTWQEFTERHQGYRDGWLQMAAYWWMLGDSKQSRLALEKALAVDPTYHPTQAFLEATR